MPKKAATAEVKASGTDRLAALKAMLAKGAYRIKPGSMPV